jgi:hypothetical protein
MRSFAVYMVLDNDGTVGFLGRIDADDRQEVLQIARRRWGRRTFHIE